MHTITKRVITTVATAALLGGGAIAGAAPAMAQEPYDFTLPAGEGCDFELGFKATGGKLITRDFVDKDGNLVRSITAGKGTVNTYTNIETGKSISINTAGSVKRTVVNDDGTLTVTATGHNGLILFPTDVPAGPSTVQYTGRIVYTIDPKTGVFTLVSTSGRSIDVCDALS